MVNANLITIFLTGLFVGGLSCLAVQGGLLAATIAQQKSSVAKAITDKEKRLKDKARAGNALPIVAFLVAKLGAYTILGFLLGWFGSIFQLSIFAQIILQLAVAIFMIGTALNILNIHPILRYFVIQPPRFLTRLVRKQSKSSQVFAPALLGAFTVFIPCGATQAVMALSIASGNPFAGAAVLFAFVLGTSPVFFLLGYFATKVGDALQRKFMKFAAIAIILLAIFNLNNAVALTGSNLTLNSVADGFWCTFSYCDKNLSQAGAQAPTSNANIAIEASGYNPDNLTVKAGSTVTLNLKNNGGGGCTQAFTIPSLNIQRIVPIGKSDTLTFTAPSQPGTLSFMCSMGMYRGTINVI